MYRFRSANAAYINGFPLYVSGYVARGTWYVGTPQIIDSS